MENSKENNFIFPATLNNYLIALNKEKKEDESNKHKILNKQKYIEEEEIHKIEKMTNFLIFKGKKIFKLR